MHLIAIVVVIVTKNIIRFPSRACSSLAFVPHLLDQALQESHVISATKVTHICVRCVV